VRDFDGLALKMDELISWVVTNCETEKVVNVWKRCRFERRCNGHVPGDRILVAQEKIAAKTMLCLPPKCVLDEQKVAKSLVGSVLQGLDKFTQFAVFLILERKNGAGSFWAPFLQTLPTEIHFHPISFLDRFEDEPDLKASVEADPMLKRALQVQREKLQTEFTLANEELKRNALEETTWNEFVWGNCMVLTRAFNIQEPKTMCMLPFVDLANHSSKNNMSWRPKLPKGYFVMTFISDVEAGNELLANYHGVNTRARSAMDKLRTFLMYGFREE